MNIFADTIAADPRRAYSAGYGHLAPPAPVFPPAPAPEAIAEPPAAEVQAGEPGPVLASTGPLSADAEPAGPGEAQGGSEDGSPAEPGGTVTPEEIEAEFGPAPVQAAQQADAAPDAEPQP